MQLGPPLRLQPAFQFMKTTDNVHPGGNMATRADRAVAVAYTYLAVPQTSSTCHQQQHFHTPK